MKFLAYYFVILALQAYIWACPFNRAVCGTDGQTYINVCEFNKARSRDRDLQILYEGSCMVRLMGHRLSNNNSNCVKKSKQKFGLLDQLLPVFIADIKVYKNFSKCRRKCAKVCPKQLYLVDNHLQLTVITISLMLTKISCSRDSILSCRFHNRLGSVCASNGRTYPSICDFKEVKLSSDPQLEIIHIGRCKKRSKFNENIGRATETEERQKQDVTKVGKDSAQDALQTIYGYLELKGTKKIHKKNAQALGNFINYKPLAYEYYDY